MRTNAKQEKLNANKGKGETSTVAKERRAERKN